MRRAIALGPLAFCSMACVMEPSTLPPVPPPPPPTVWEDATTALPPPTTAPVPLRTEALAAWQLPPTIPWARYEKLTLLASLGVAPRAGALPDVSQLPTVDLARRAASAVAAGGLPPDTMWIVDLRGAASVAFGATLSRQASEPVANVMTFNNWPADDELVPAEETLAALVSMSPRLPASGAAGARPVFLLDSWRLAYKSSEPDEGVTDNRYFLGESDLPDPSTLVAMNVHKVMYVVERIEDTPREEDDLNATFLAYQRAGIAILIIDLEGLTRRAYVHQDVLGRYERQRLLYVEPRVTLVEDPWFYHRSRGGFGGGGGGPVWVPHGGGGGYGSRGGGGG